MSHDSRAKEIMQYSFLVAFANDGVINANELAFIKKQALADGVVDEAEKDVIRQIFAKVDRNELSPEVAQEMDEFIEQYEIG